MEPHDRDPVPEESTGGTHRRALLAAVGGSAMAAALAGCTALFGDDDDNGAAEGDVPDEPIEAGLQTFTEGPAAVLGVQARYGAEVAVDRINDNGGVAGRNVELEVVHEGDEQVENYTAFVEDGKDVTFGPISSGGHAAMVPEIEDRGVVNVSTDGTVTTLYEEDFTDPTYSFRFQNHDVMEVLASVRIVDEVLGLENVDTVAGINPNYAFGQDEQELFALAMESLADAEVLYEGWPDLNADDMSTHIAEVNGEEPDVVFSSCWGGDATLLLDQAQANDMMASTEMLVGPVFYGSANDFDPGLLEGEIYSGSRNFYWGFPDTDRWTPGQDLVDDVVDEFGEVPTAHFMSGYGAVTAWATAAEQATRVVGGWPSQEQIAATLEGHGFFTPAGYHTIGRDHQGYANAHAGSLEWSDEYDAARLENVVTFDPREVSPPPGQTSRDWIGGW